MSAAQSKASTSRGFNSVDGDQEGVQDSGIEMEVEGLGQNLNRLLESMGYKIGNEATEHYPLIPFTEQENIQISEGSFLRAQSETDWSARIENGTSLGSDHFVSSRNLHKFLDVLFNVIARPNEASNKAWAEAFLYRVSAMQASDRKLVFNVDSHHPPIKVRTPEDTDVELDSMTAYSVIIAEKEFATSLLERFNTHRLPQYIKSEFRLFVVDARHEGINIMDYVPQVANKLYASAIRQKKLHIRGALTNGYKWYFIILTINPNEGGAEYRVTHRPYSVTPSQGIQVKIPYEVVDLVAALLASWIERSWEPLSEVDWFE